jgi:transposase
MADQDLLLSALGNWPGFRVTGVSRRETDPPEIWIRLEPTEDAPYRCAHCGAQTRKVHEKSIREIRDLPLFDARTYLQVTVFRVWCDSCGGPKRMQVDWLDEHQRVTQRLANSIISLCALLPIDHVARYYGVHWHTVKRLDKVALKARLDPVDLSTVTIIGMDEFALHKGHRYATVVVEPPTKRVLWVGRGRGRADVRPFFELLGEQCQHIEAAVMDMNGSYELEVRQHCPGAEIVFDLFHVVAKYGREVIDRVRVDEANRLRQDKPARQVVKSARWLLLRNRDRIQPADQVRLTELLEANSALMTVYVLRDDLKSIWRYRDRAEAAEGWSQWFERAISSGIQALHAFATKLKPYLHGILAHCRWPLHTGIIEGMNNRIKVIKRMAYGYRDEEYFFLKIRAAFPGLAR